MTIHLIQQIELAERLTPSWSDATHDPRFVPSAHTAVRDLSARLPLAFDESDPQPVPGRELFDFGSQRRGLLGIGLGQTDH